MEKFRILKYNRAKLAIMDYIGKARLQPGDKLPPERELVEILPCSKITMRHALAELEQENVIKRNRRTGTFLTKKLKDNSFSCHILFVSVARHGEEKPWNPTLESVRLFLAERGIGLRIITVYEFGDDIMAAAREAIGIMISGWVSDSLLERMALLHLPMVIVGNNELDTPIPRVMLDLETTAFRQTRRLMESGKRRIALIGGTSGYYPAHLYEAGYRKALQNSGLEEKIFHPHDVISGWIDDFEKFMNTGDRPDAFLLESSLIHNIASWYWRHPEEKRPNIAFLSAPSGYRQYKQSDEYCYVVFSDMYLQAATMLLGVTAEGIPMSSQLIPPVIHGVDDDTQVFIY